MPKYLSRAILTAALFAVAVVSGFAQQKARFDVTNYKIDAQLEPATSRLTTTADVTFTLEDAARTVVFELNGALKVESVTRLGAPSAVATVQPSPAARPATRPTAPRPTPAPTTTAAPIVTFTQDQVGNSSDVGPYVRVDLGDTVAAGTVVTLRFKYAGALLTAEGGPLANKKLVSVDDTVSYLTYAGRWFPFHNYAADRSTAEFLINVPTGFQVAGFSDEAVTQTATGGMTRYRFVNAKPALVGNFVAGKFLTRNLKIGATELQFYVQPANEKRIAEYGEQIGKALEFYNSRYGAADNAGKYIVAEIDDESLDTYSGLGMLMISARYFETPPQNFRERLERETAYQWWGNAVGLKSFDDAWLSQGLAEYSALELRESTAKGADAEDINRELLERALTFEQTASIIRAPGTLDDQTAAYQYIMFYKGSSVFRLLRETLGAQNFNALLKTYLAQYRGKNASIDDFEKLASTVAGKNMRYFFARWVEGTGVPEFKSDYQIIRKRGGTFVARGTVSQNYDNLQLPVEVRLRSEGNDESQIQTLKIEDTSEDFNLETKGKPIEVVVDPNYKLLRSDDELKVSAIARRGIEQFKEGNYAEAQQQFEIALKLNRSNSWVYYHLGLLFLEQRNYDLAIENFKATLNGNLRPSWLGVWANVKMGNAYDAKGDRTRAVAAYKRAQENGSDYDGAQDAAKKYLATPYDPKTREATASK